MIQLLTQNPYRVLGVFSNSPKKEVLSSIGKIKAHIKVDKPVSFALDLPMFLPAPIRNEISINEAQAAIELPMDQIKHSLFWFMNATSFDEIAFNHLFDGNIAQAKDIWQKKETVSSLLNLMTCALIENDLSIFVLCADKLFQNHADEFCHLVNETIRLSPRNLIEKLIEFIETDNAFNIEDLAQISGTSPDWKQVTQAGLIKPLINRISSAITEAKNSIKNAKNYSAHYQAGVHLSNITRSDLQKLKELLGVSDMQYQMLADKLAETILQCGINYYNGSDNDDTNAPHNAMSLQRYALSLAVGKVVKDRCQENVAILERAIENLPPKEVANTVADIKKELRKFNALPDKISHSIDLLNNTKPLLSIVKNVLGVSNPFYLKLSTLVVSNALHNVIEEVNDVQRSMISNSDTGRLIFTVGAAWRATLLMDSFDMEPVFKQRYKTNRDTLSKIHDKLNNALSEFTLPEIHNEQNKSNTGCIIAIVLLGITLIIAICQ